jgi:hypothetical protein
MVNVNGWKLLRSCHRASALLQTDQSTIGGWAMVAETDIVPFQVSS